MDNLEEALEIADQACFELEGQHLNDVEMFVLRSSLQDKTYEQMATERYTVSYLKYDVGPQLWGKLSQALQERVSKRNFRAALERWHLKVVSQSKEPDLKRDWKDAPELPNFYGRTEEHELLKKWIVKERCRVVAILGMAGIGKTSLSLKLGKSDSSIQEEFKYIIWRSLLNAPPVTDILADILKFLSKKQNDIKLPDTVDEQISQLLEYLRSSRCLLILDNAEAILEAGDPAGQYRKGCEKYGKLLKQLGEIEHQSCLLLTSREKPPEIARLETRRSPAVRSLKLKGLKELDVRQIFREIGSFYGKDEEWKQLIELYNGNPLALELTAKHIEEVFLGDISKFLAEGKPVFNDLRELLNWHFNRLSDREKEIMYWLAINCEPMSLSDLKEDILSLVAQEEVPSTLQLLQRRLPIEKPPGRFTLQPVLKEYMTEQLVDKVFQELQTGDSQKIEIFNTHALLKATAKDYVRETQRRLILAPLIDMLTNELGSPKMIQTNLKRIIKELQQESPPKPGYAGGNILNLLCELKIDLSNSDFSNLTIRQAYLKGVSLKNVKFCGSDLTKSVFTNTLSSVLSVALSPDGKHVVTGDTKNQIFLWKIEDGQQISSFDKHKNWVWSVVFSPDGKTVASASDDNTVIVWDVMGTCLRTLEHPNWVRAIAFSPDGRKLASGCDDGKVRIWDIQTGAELKTSCPASDHTNRVWSVAFSPDGKILVSGSDDKTVKIWDVQTGKCRETLEGHTDKVQSVDFNLDGQTIASGSADATVRIWDTQTAKCHKILYFDHKRIWSVAFHPQDHKLLVVGSDDDIVTIQNIDNQEIVQSFRGHKRRVRSVSFSPNGQVLATGSEDQTVKIWDFETGKCLQTLQGQIERIWSIAFNPVDSATIISGGEDRKIRIWDTRPDGPNEPKMIIPERTDWIWSVAFSPDGQKLATGSDDKIVRIWDFETHKCLQELEGHRNWIRSVAFSPDGEQLASGSDGHTVRLWNVQTGKCIKTLREHTDRVRSVAFSPDGQQLASASDDKTIKIWNVQTGECLNTLLGHTDRVRSVAFSSDGEQLVSSSDDKTIKLWDVKKGECLKTLRGHIDQVESVAISPDNRYIVSGSDDQTAKIWEVQTGKCLRSLEHTDKVKSVAFSPNGEIIATSSQDAEIKLWNVRKILVSKLKKSYKILKVYPLYYQMDITGAIGLTDTQKYTLRILGADDTLKQNKVST